VGSFPSPPPQPPQFPKSTNPSQRSLVVVNQPSFLFFFFFFFSVWGNVLFLSKRKIKNQNFENDFFILRVSMARNEPPNKSLTCQIFYI
jgi:hypothetical protein